MDENAPAAADQPPARPAARANAAGSGRRTLSEPALKAAGQWIQQFARTLKTCRLYEATNPTVVRFRDELGASLARTLGEFGALTYRFEADDVTCDGVSLLPARSREDNLAFAFYRDGVRGLTLQPGAHERDLGAVLDCVLAVTGQNLDGDDLVTLFWEANLQHVDVDYIPSEGDAGTTTPNSQTDADGPLLPWPTASAVDEPPAAAGGESAAPGASGRSEDWALGETTVDVEATFIELDTLAPVEVERFRREHREEHEVPPATAALAIANACLHANAEDKDRLEFGRFVPRVIHAALAAGQWADARDALRVVRDLRPPEWAEETFVQELLQPVSIARTVERLDQQGPDTVVEFIALAAEVGDAGIDWVALALSDSQQRVVRLALAEALAERCREHPERLAPWLLNARWYVVRNIVHILGWIGGPAVIGMLQKALRHPDARVRAEVVEALAPLDLGLARPLLVKALERADTKLFCRVLQLLSAAREPATARYVFAFVRQERFFQRPPEERRAIYAAIASIGGDELVADLEQELQGGNWFDREHDLHRHAIARCLSRIGTPAAVTALLRGAQSRRAPVRQACEAAMGRAAA